ncbi:hypothetical protein [Sphingomonas sp.]|jgi:hypothetical protein|uniref:hypothetical protein n=1 Tax=Sphingomonas sp. TaxID=28214 RepID=UPI0035C7CD6F
MIAISALLALAQTVTPPEARRPPDERLQNHGQNVVVKHDPVGGKVDIVAEEAGSCPGPGPTTIMRLRSADKDRTMVVTVSKSVNAAGLVTTSRSEHVLAPLAAIDLGCLAQPGAGGARPTVNEWKIVSARAQ